VHLREVGQVVADAIKAAGAIPREFNTIAVDDAALQVYAAMATSAATGAARDITLIAQPDK
jgi:dihydroxy-acid dehydratase